eukprot:9412227-Pyramimonas_sp.AAC.2
MTDVREGRLSEFERTGNHEADRLAKEWASLSMHAPPETLLAKGCLSLARDFLKYITKSEVHYSGMG